MNLTAKLVHEQHNLKRFDVSFGDIPVGSITYDCSPFLCMLRVLITGVNYDYLRRIDLETFLEPLNAVHDFQCAVDAALKYYQSCIDLCTDPRIVAYATEQCSTLWGLTESDI